MPQRKRVIVIHGWGGDPNGGWKPWLRRQLEARGFAVEIPQMPDSENPKMGRWLETLGRIVRKPGIGTILVGHSLGAVCILRYLERLGESEKMGGAVLVAGLAEDTGIPQLKSFFPQKSYDWERIRKHCVKFITINSDDDCYVPLSHGRTFRDKLGAKLIIKKSHGHFSSADGFDRLPVVLESVLEIAGEKEGG
ncbi:MAG: alpha/beta hydrolase [Candidatus Micrarchaeota archaeon]|nr:alpha/beta hydrolase [Candidatus Micrarchaeota archaeon]